jgi:hypothetical protein
MHDIDFVASVLRAFDWLEHHGFSPVRQDRLMVVFQRGALAVEVSLDPRDGEIALLVCRESSPRRYCVSPADILIFEGAADSAVGLTSAQISRSNVYHTPKIRNAEEAAAALNELSAFLNERQKLLDPSATLLTDVMSSARFSDKKAANTPRWVSAERVARVFADVGDWPAVVKQLAPFEAELDDETRSLLTEARNKVKG